MRKLSYLLMIFILFICSGCNIIAGQNKNPIEIPTEEKNEGPTNENNNVNNPNLGPLEPTVGEPEVEDPTDIPTSGDIDEPTSNLPTDIPTSGEVEEPTQGEEDKEIEEVIPEINYDEPVDSVEGIDVSDLSKLKQALDSIGHNYISHTNVYFNELALEQVNDIFSMNFISEQTAYYTENYVYRYSDNFSINTAYVNRNNNVYGVKLPGSTLKDKLTSSINSNDLVLELENSNLYDIYFSLNSLNSSYVDTYTGEHTVKYSNTYSVTYKGWTRVSENKYKCDRLEVIQDFINICMPSYPKQDGAYMTYKYVTVEINPNSETYLRIRLYANDTQGGKINYTFMSVDENENPLYPNWYLLLAEANISNVGDANIGALENIN